MMPGGDDAVVVGSGPNGLSAAIVLARAGLQVTILEAEESLGGGARSEQATLPGFVHDLCSAVHPLAIASPFFRTLPLREHGLEWIQPEIPLAHPLDHGSAALLKRSVASTAEGLGRDAPRYRRFVEPLADAWPELLENILAPFRWPRRPVRMARFGLGALRSARSFAESRFRDAPARALFAGCAAHSMLPMEMRASSAIGLVLLLAAHAGGWPIPKSGAGRITAALASHLGSLGGEIRTGTRVESLEELSGARLLLLDVTPRQLLRLGGRRLPDGYRRALQRYRYGPAAFKIDWALDGPVPWTASVCAHAGTLHLGGSLEEIAESERAPWEGRLPEQPFVLFSQPTLFDPSRAPQGKHVAWGYCHLPNGSDPPRAEMIERIERQVERFAPGFRDRILERRISSPRELEARNANLVGGDINGGASTLGQLFLRPTRRLYRTPLPGVYLCSSSTPPGGGVHGMCGYHAARAALRDLGL